MAPGQVKDAVGLALLASGTGTTAGEIMEAAGHTINACVRLVICNNSSAGAMSRARERGVPTAHLSGVTHPDPDDLDAAMLAALRAVEVDLIVLAGYMKKVGPRVLEHYAGKIVNTHPALLPAYGGKGMYGDRVHAAVLADGVRVSGASVHEVTAEYDEGAVLAQVPVPVHLGDDIASLRTRVQAAEKDLLMAWLGSYCRP